nr:MAG TPA: hypothetical protein [Caudoviricetes sp.]
MFGYLIRKPPAACNSLLIRRFILRKTLLNSILAFSPCAAR